MNIRFLETFVLLAKLRNFRLTAEHLNTTQAAVSSRIASLELEFGVRLFDRSAREAALTPDGNKALVYAERMVTLMREMKDEMSDKRAYTGTIRIGVIESIVYSWFPDFLSRLHESFPRLQIEIASDTTIHLHQQFGKGNLDLLLQAEPVPGAQVRNTALCEFPMRWVGSPRLRIGNGKLSLADLTAYPVVSFARNSGPHAVIERMLPRTANGNLHINCIASVATIIRLVANGFGVAAVPPAIIQNELREGILQLLNVDADFPPLTMIGSFRSDHDNPLIEIVSAIASDAASDFASKSGRQIARVPSPVEY